MVAVVYNGTKSTGGYDVEITSVEDDENSNVLVINFMTSEPTSGSINTYNGTFSTISYYKFGGIK